MPKASYSFTRCDSVTGFFSTNRASTDALNALQSWSGSNGRSYEIQRDKDDQLVASLEFGENDDQAGPDLDDKCKNYGIKRTIVNDK